MQQLTPDNDPSFTDPFEIDIHNIIGKTIIFEVFERTEDGEYLIYAQTVAVKVGSASKTELSTYLCLVTPFELQGDDVHSDSSISSICIRTDGAVLFDYRVLDDPSLSRCAVGRVLAIK